MVICHKQEGGQYPQKQSAANLDKESPSAVMYTAMLYGEIFNFTTQACMGMSMWWGMGCHISFLLGRDQVLLGPDLAVLGGWGGGVRRWGHVFNWKSRQSQQAEKFK